MPEKTTNEKYLETMESLTDRHLKLARASWMLEALMIIEKHWIDELRNRISLYSDENIWHDTN